MSPHTLALTGCAPTPLAHYLKALGVLRLLSEQLPSDLPRPRGAWQGETFVLHSPLDRGGLESFFLNHCRPTLILAPWNGGSGFYFGEEKPDEIDRSLGWLVQDLAFPKLGRLPSRGWVPCAGMTRPGKATKQPPRRVAVF